MSTAHGAGLMLLPVTLATPSGTGHAGHAGHGGHNGHGGPAAHDAAMPVLSLTEQALLATAWGIALIGAGAFAALT